MTTCHSGGIERLLEEVRRKFPRWEWTLRSPSKTDCAGRPSQYFCSIHTPGAELDFDVRVEPRETKVLSGLYGAGHGDCPATAMRAAIDNIHGPE